MLQHCWTTSWGLSTRFIGAIIMVHGDDQGLILPPRLAPYPAGDRADLQDRRRKSAACWKCAQKLRKELVDAGIRVKLDEREGSAPASNSTTGKCAACRCGWNWVRRMSPKAPWCWRDATGPGKEGKSFVAAARNCGCGGSDARRNSESAFRSRARFSQSEHRRTCRLRGVQEGRREGLRVCMVVRRMPIAKPTSRKKPRRPCVAFLWNSPAEPASASTAASLRKKRPYSPERTSR